MAKHWHQRQGLFIRSGDVDDEYGIPQRPGTTAPVPTTPPARNVWSAGRYVQPGEVYEPLTENGFSYTAIQPTAAYTGTAEPAWPVIVGGTVVDGGVTWQAAAKTSVTWTAVPMYKTGATEPAWSLTLGGTTVDGSVTWETQTPQITDPRCPHSELARPMSSKIFSPYLDVTRYSATNDPRDWSTADDAGFLPTGQHSPESVIVTGLGEYRGRLAIWTSALLQIWTTDPDPAEMALFDAIPGVGTTYPEAIVPVANDLLFMTKMGMRSLSIAASATNLATSDVGSPIDPLIQAELGGPYPPVGFFYPGSGQCWVAFGAKVYVYSQSRTGKVGGWSYYEFPFPIEGRTTLAGELYLRSGNRLYKLNEMSVDDDGVEFEGIVWWNYLDCGSPGTTKMMHGLDVVGFGEVEVSVGYDQNNPSAYTTPFLTGPDTVPGGMIPLPIAAPSFALKLRYPGGQAWSMLAAALYLDDMGTGR